MKESTLELLYTCHLIYRAPYTGSVCGGREKHPRGQGHYTAIPAGIIVVTSAPLDSQVLITSVTLPPCLQCEY